MTVRGWGLLFGIAWLVGSHSAASANPAAASPVVRRSVESPPPLNTPTTRAIPSVEIFVTAWCPYCRALESFLSSYKVPYIKYDVEHDAKGIEVYQRLGAGGVPLIRIDGKRVMRGFSPEELKKALGLNVRDAQLVVSALGVKDSLDLVE